SRMSRLVTEVVMKTNASPCQVSRREFIKTTGGVAVAAAAIAPALLAPAADDRTSKIIGLQVGAVSFVDEGIEPVLAILQEKGAVNAICLTTFTYGRGLGGRQI